MKPILSTDKRNQLCNATGNSVQSNIGFSSIWPVVFACQSWPTVSTVNYKGLGDTYFISLRCQ